MKIPNLLSSVGSAYISEMFVAWRKEAINLSMKTGIFIDVKEKYDNNPVFPITNELVFAIGDKEFDNLIDLKRALKLKSFI